MIQYGALCFSSIQLFTLMSTKMTLVRIFTSTSCFFNPFSLHYQTAYKLRQGCVIALPIASVSTTEARRLLLIMETVIKLAFLTLQFLLIAFVITVVVSLGPLVLGREHTDAQFWRMFRVTCVILLILKALVCSNL